MARMKPGNGTGTSRRFVGPSPIGLGYVKPNHYREIAKTLRENSDQLGFAWRILNDGCCDGCSLGTVGMRDWTIPGIHLCTVRLKMLRLNTMPAADVRTLERPQDLRAASASDLRRMGRLPHPMVWRRGEPGYRRVTWDEALDVCAGPIRRAAERDPDRMYFYLTSRGMPNETYFAFQKVSRFLGTNNIDNSARVCHAPSTSALGVTIGYGATTCSYTDWIGTDLLILVGTNIANNQPVAMKYVDEAKKKGTRVVVVNTYREEGLERYWVPSSWDSALFGTRMMDEFFQVTNGGDAAFFTGAVKHLIETDRVNHEFISRCTTGIDALREYVRGLSWEQLERGAGTTEAEMRRFADLYAGVETSITVWSMGVTQHEHGQQNVFAISNLSLAMGRIGRPRTGLNPIRGHSGVQGGAEVGAVPTSYGQGRRVGDPQAMAAMKEIWGFDVPGTAGLTASAAMHAAHDGRLDVLYSAGGNFLETMPDPEYVREALERVPVRIFQDIVLNPMMLLPPGEVSVILPGATRYETPGGITETTTERRIVFSPEIPGRRIGEAKPEWEIPMLIAERVVPNRRNLIHYATTAEIRQDIARVVRDYEGIQHLQKKGDQVQWGGPRLCADHRFRTPDGRAHFAIPRWPDVTIPPGRFSVSTRRGNQFNSMVWGEHDPLTGSDRDDVLVSPQDARSLGLTTGDPVLLRSEIGEFHGKIRIAGMAPRNLEVHWPEANALIRSGHYDPSCGEPDYNAICELIPLGRHLTAPAGAPVQGPPGSFKAPGGAAGST
ncbi:MAG TPA: FdhF/YdeP family oxidoreductase [bacterium]|nr:FdhF/YdeP family oxidoreductase [bacterium]